jgi:hypothetical protein
LNNKLFLHIWYATPSASMRPTNREIAELEPKGQNNLVKMQKTNGK